MTRPRPKLFSHEDYLPEGALTISVKPLDGIDMGNLTEIVEEMLRVLYNGTEWSEDPHLKDTPERVAEAWKEMLVPQKWRFNVFDNVDGADQMVSQCHIPFYSMCAHHMLPFFGEAHVAYIPSPQGQIVGLSKLARVVRHFSRALTLQERISEQVVTFLDKHLDPQGAACVIDARHLCEEMRGVKAAGAITRTTKLTGFFFDDEKARAELFSKIDAGRPAL